MFCLNEDELHTWRMLYVIIGENLLPMTLQNDPLRFSNLSCQSGSTLDLCKDLDTSCQHVTICEDKSITARGLYQVLTV